MFKNSNIGVNVSYTVTMTTIVFFISVAATAVVIISFIRSNRLICHQVASCTAKLRHSKLFLLLVFLIKFFKMHVFFVYIILTLYAPLLTSLWCYYFLCLFIVLLTVVVVIVVTILFSTNLNLLRWQVINSKLTRMSTNGIFHKKRNLRVSH